MKKVELIDNSQETLCYVCGGTGLVIKKYETPACKECNGTGKYKESHYLLIATQPSGDKIAFNVDQEGK